MHEKFGKSFQDILSIKQDFFKNNQEHLDKAIRYADLYVSQPRRTACKICEAPLPDEPSFTKHKVPYILCTNCGHLNGQHEDSDDFCAEVYRARGGKDYAKNYTPEDSKSFNDRVTAIYKPKAEFLMDVLRKDGEEPEKLRYADMGAGAGYFISALNQLDVGTVRGFEVGEALVDLGKWMMPSADLDFIEPHQTAQILSEVEADVATFIGVFEHVQNPREILQAIRANKTIRYFYFCVPMFSPTIYNEMAFPHVMPRQLSGGHTHLFTRSSIAHFEKEFGLEPIGAWWFGTDMMDYYRSVHVSLARDSSLQGMQQHWDTLFSTVLDDLQLAIDKRRMSSQVHMLMHVPK